MPACFIRANVAPGNAVVKIGDLTADLDDREARAAVLVALIAVAALAAVAYASGVIPGTERCVWRSVDKDSYVARNEAVFATIRLQNGPPYEAYVTWHVFVQPLGQYPRGYDRRLLGPKWISQNGGLSGESFRRGQASLYITSTDEATSFSVDHRG
jgi:hypothetical protein